MATTKYKVGDLVRVREGLFYETSEYDGQIGFVDNVDEHDTAFPYRIRFISNGETGWFAHKELEHAS